MIICLNEKFLDRKEAKISVFDYGLLCGYGVFTTIAAINGKIFFLNDHLDRLFDNCQKIKLPVPWSRKKLKNLIQKTVQKNSLSSAKIRVIITRGESDALLYSQKKLKPNLIIIAVKLKKIPRRFYIQGIKLLSTPLQRVLPEIKSLNFLPSLFRYQEAKAKRYDDALFIDHKKNVTEGTTFNIFMIKNDIITTPAKDILMGVTRNKVIDLAKSLKFKVNQKIITLKELLKADEIFITGTTKKIVPVVKIDKTHINSGKIGKITTQLMKEFTDLYF